MGLLPASPALPIPHPDPSRIRPPSHPDAQISSQKSLFVDNVRFWSMFGIVAIHCTATTPAALPHIDRRILYLIEDPLKFATIAFFIISGFLLGNRFENSKPLHFLHHRLQKVFLPWLFWFAIQVAYFLSGCVLLKGTRLACTAQSFHFISGVVFTCLTATAFWFVPNLLLAVCILLLFRRSLRSLWFGATLLTFNLFHALNIYTGWVESSHTVALLGFVFYLWLGAFASRHFDTILRRTARITTTKLTALLFGGALLSLAETFWLAHLHNSDPTNTLRLSNQLFSLIAVLWFTRLRHATWPSFIDVRTRMFGVYLTHTLLLGMVASSAKYIVERLPPDLRFNGSFGFLALAALTTALVFASCLALSAALARSPALSWIISAPEPAVRQGSSPRLPSPQGIEANPSSRPASSFEPLPALGGTFPT